MASSFSLLSVLFCFFLFINCGGVYGDTESARFFSLHNFACAKSNFMLHNGLVAVDGNNRLRIDPSKLSTNESEVTVHTLRVDAKDERLVMSVVFNGMHENCKTFFASRIQMPNGCVIGEETEMPDAKDNGCETANGQCTTLNVTCNLKMRLVEKLPNARHFAMTLWKNSSSDDENGELMMCDWKAVVENVYILLNKTDHTSEAFVEHCWEKEGTNTMEYQLLLYVGIIVLLVVALAIVVVVLVVMHRRQHRHQTVHFNVEVETINNNNSPEKKRDMRLMSKGHVQEEFEQHAPALSVTPTSSTSSKAQQRSIAAEVGVEVPESFLSRTSDDELGGGPIRVKHSAPKKKMPKKSGPRKHKPLDHDFYGPKSFPGYEKKAARKDVSSMLPKDDYGNMTNKHFYGSRP